MKNLVKISDKPIKKIKDETNKGTYDYISAIILAQTMMKAAQLQPPKPLRGIGKIKYWFWKIYENIKNRS